MLLDLTIIMKGKLIKYKDSINEIEATTIISPHTKEYFLLMATYSPFFRETMQNISERIHTITLKIILYPMDE